MQVLGAQAEGVRGEGVWHAAACEDGPPACGEERGGWEVTMACIGGGDLTCEIVTIQHCKMCVLRIEVNVHRINRRKQEHQATVAILMYMAKCITCNKRHL